MNDFKNINFDLLKKELIRDEADRRKLYDDKTGKEITSLSTGGNITGGIGRNFFAKPLSDEIVELLFVEDVTEAIHDLRLIFKYFDSFSQKRQHALINMMFNLGATRFRKFVNMIDDIELYNWDSAAECAKASLWFKQVGKRGERIVEDIKNG